MYNTTNEFLASRYPFLPLFFGAFATNIFFNGVFASQVSFAGNGPNTRSTQLFVSFAGIGLGDAPHEVGGEKEWEEESKIMFLWLFNALSCVWLINTHASTKDIHPSQCPQLLLAPTHTVDGLLM